MSKVVDFYYDFVSPAAYLAWTQLDSLCERTGARVRFRPVLLGGMLKHHGQGSPAMVPAKWQWMQKDFARYAKAYGVDFSINPHFIFNSITVMRGALWALDNQCIEVYNRAIFTAAWVDGLDLSSVDVVHQRLAEAGLDASAILEATAQPEVKQSLIHATAQACERGVFGVPSMVVEDELFFGQDRLSWVEQALSASD